MRTIGSGSASALRAQIDARGRWVGCELGQSAGAGKARRVAVRRYRRKQRLGVCLVRPCGVKGLRVFLQALSVAAVPALDCCGRPLRRFVRVTIVAGIRGAEAGGKVGARYPETVVMPAVDHHVGARRHVARRAGKRRNDLRVPMMARSRIFFRRVALLADAVTRGAKLAAVRLMAVAAGDAGCEHLALLERAVVVDLVAHLSVRLVETPGER